MALKRRPKDVEKIVMSAAPQDAWTQVAKTAEKLRIPVIQASEPAEKNPIKPAKKGYKGDKRFRPSKNPKEAKESKEFNEEGRSSKNEAWIKPKEPVPVEVLFEASSESEGEGRGLWIAADQIQDPHNMGAIFRIAGFFGVRGVLLPKDRSAALSEVVYDVSSGGVEAVPYSIVSNLQRAFEVAKERGFWLLGTSEHATESLYTVQPDRDWLLVLGNEEKGMRRLTSESCDVVVQIPARGDVDSLNVSVAAGVMVSWLRSKPLTFSSKSEI